MKTFLDHITVLMAISIHILSAYILLSLSRKPQTALKIVPNNFIYVLCNPFGTPLNSFLKAVFIYKIYVPRLTSAGSDGFVNTLKNKHIFDKIKITRLPLKVYTEKFKKCVSRYKKFINKT